MAAFLLHRPRRHDMNQMEIFKNPEFGAIRAVESDGEPWLVGKDVALALGYKNPQEAIRNHVDAEDKGVSEILTPGGKQKILIINESGLYSLILSSKLDSAKRFKRWVTHDVIPSIRKTGSYSLDTSDSNTAVQVKDMFSQITEALQEIKNSYALDAEWKNKIERYCTKIGVMTKDVKASVGFINYLMRRGATAKRTSKWKMTTKPRINALADYLCADGMTVLRNIYLSMEDEFDIDLNEYAETYRYINNLDQCSTLDVIDADRALRQYFDVITDDLLERFGLTVDSTPPHRKTIFDECPHTQPKEVIA